MASQLLAEIAQNPNKRFVVAKELKVNTFQVDFSL